MEEELKARVATLEARLAEVEAIASHYYRSLKTSEVEGLNQAIQEAQTAAKRD